MAAPQLVRTGPSADPDPGPHQMLPDEDLRPGLPAGDDMLAGSAAPDQRSIRSWPLLLLALPAAVAVWSGWVGIGQLTDFGQVRPLPGIWNSLHIDSAITLPVGVEAYAAYALHAWLAASTSLTDRTRRFAKWSAIGSLLLGMAGQVAYHLLVQARVTRAPWPVTTVVACLPVLILGMAAGLTHLILADASTAPGARQVRADPASEPAGVEAIVRPGRLAEALAAASQLTATGRRVSRRGLRAAGMSGSNAELNKLARTISARLEPGG